MERKSSIDIAVTMVRIWTRIYTWRMAADVREIRLGEIESDLWELQHDRESRSVSPALHIVARLVLGVPSDVCWRVEQIALEPEAPRAVMTAAVALVAAVLWILPAWYSRSETRRTRTAECAESFESDPASKSRADYRMHVIACAGAFFARNPPTSAP